MRFYDPDANDEVEDPYAILSVGLAIAMYEMTECV